MDKKETPEKAKTHSALHSGSEAPSSSDINRLRSKLGYNTDSHGEEAKHVSNTEDQKEHWMAAEEKKPRALWQIRLERIMDSAYMQIFMSLLSIFALFADEIRMVAFNKYADTAFYTLLCISMGIFFVEIFLCSICKEDYFMSFFFWLDIISTVSLVGDIAWIVPESSSIGQTTTDVAKNARAGRAARIIRLIRLIRLIRITKIYKEAQKQRKQMELASIGLRRTSARVTPINAPAISAGEDAKKQDRKSPRHSMQGAPSPKHSSGHLPEPLARSNSSVSSTTNEVPPESNTSRILSELTTQRVIVLVIVLTFCLPLFDNNSYTDPPYTPPYAVKALADAHNKMNSTEFANLCAVFCKSETKDDYYPLIYVSGPDCGPFYYSVSEDDLRLSEVMVAEDRGYRVVADVRAYTKLNSGLGIGRTLFLCVLLAVGAILFSNDTTTLVLYPLESMLEKVRILATNPMAFCLATSDAELGVYSMQRKLEGKGENYETQYLESLIVKIARLLAVEFGEAGTKIIVTNLSSNDFLNPMIPGNKMCAVFGFCIINSFEETTEVLQTDVMLYLNEIAETIHSTIDKYLGSTNKNIGEAFLVLWKFPEDDVEMTPTGPVAKSKLATIEVDLALFSYIKIIAKINKLQHILKYSENEAIKRKFPHYKLKMGFGLHVGWAIEGAVGSVHKIDASYLSPNVNISARLEAATKQYGVPLLLSGQVYNMLSPNTKKYCREIDTVTVKGSVTPIKLFTVDLDVHALQPKKCKYSEVEPGQKKMMRLQKRKTFHTQVKSETKTTYSIYESDKDLEVMRAGVNQGFVKQYQEGYANYVSGNWNQAIENFRKALVLRPNDGPTMTLLSYMEAHNGMSPPTWKGFRVLTEK